MKYIPILFALFILYACKKDNDKIIDYNGTYQGDMSVYHDAAVLYTNKGIIRDSNKVKDFANRRGIPRYNFVFDNGKGNIFTAGTTDSVFLRYRAVINNDSIYFMSLNYNFQPLHTDTGHLTRVNSNTILMVNNRLTYTTTGDNGNLSCTNAVTYFRAFQPAYNCVMSNCSAYEQLPFTIKNGAITYPYFMYYFVKNISFIDDAHECFSQNDGVKDQFNGGIIKQFAAGDTLLLVRYYRTLYKQ